MALKWPMAWRVYILCCANGSYYVGHTHDLETRLETHQEGKGSAHTAKYRPVTLVYSEKAADKTSAVRRERQLKKWSHAKKEALIRGDVQRLKRLARCRGLYPDQEGL